MSTPSEPFYCPYCDQELPYSLDLTFNPDSGIVMGNGRMASLTPSQFTILHHLWNRQGQVLTRENLVDHLHPFEPSEDEKPDPKTIDVVVSKIRKQTKALGVEIVSHRGRGYSLSIRPPEELKAISQQTPRSERVASLQRTAYSPEDVHIPGISGHTPELSWIPLEQLIVDHSYQREVKPGLVRKIVQNFDWRLFRPPSVTPIGAHRYAVFDGQHVTEAARVLEQITTIPCYVVPDMNLEEQAMAFIETNTERHSLNSIDQYHAKVSAKLSPFYELNHLVQDLGLSIPPVLGMNRPKMITAVETLQNLYERKGEAHTKDVLTLLRDAQPTSTQAFSKHLLRGVSSFLQRYPGADKTETVHVLSGMDIRDIEQETHEYIHVHRKSGPVAFSEVLRRHYNHHVPFEKQLMT